MQNKLSLIPSQSLLNQVKSETNDLILYFSCGKDSIATWLYLRGYGFNIYPVYLYTVPGLRSDAENLAYYENYFGQHIMRFPHPIFYQMLDDLVYQPPERAAQLVALNLPHFSFTNIDQVISRGYGLPDNYYAAMGMRMADNLDRRMMMYQNGVLGQKSRRFYYPIWDWNIERVSKIIKENKIKLPKIYRSTGRTIAAIHYQYLKPFKELYPDDYDRILDWFPLLDAEFFRYERLSNGQKKYWHVG